MGLLGGSGGKDDKDGGSGRAKGRMKRRAAPKGRTRQEEEGR